MKQVRDGIPWITPDTMIQKTIPLSDVDNYLSGKYNTVGGYVAKMDDVSNLKNYEDVLEGLRLDYLDANGNRVFPDNGEGYAVIKYTSNSVNNIEIPYGATFGGTNTDDFPCTQNGFTGARNGSIIPEFKFDSYYKPKDGAEIYTVINGSEELVAVYVEKLKKFVPVK